MLPSMTSCHSGARGWAELHGKHQGSVCVIKDELREDQNCEYRSRESVRYLDSLLYRVIQLLHNIKSTMRALEHSSRPIYRGFHL